jgi:hypothetical protein
MILDVVLALVISLYLLIDGPRFRARSLAVIPEQHRAKALFLQDNVSRVLGGYLRGQLTPALIVGVLAGVGTALLGLPYASVLGVLDGLFELLPMFGPILSVVPAVLVALFMPFPTIVWVLLFFLVIQQVENNVLAPRISGHAVGLHPPRSHVCAAGRFSTRRAVRRSAGWRAVGAAWRPGIATWLSRPRLGARSFPSLVSGDLPAGLCLTRSGYALGLTAAQAWIYNLSLAFRWPHMTCRTS